MRTIIRFFAIGLILVSSLGSVMYPAFAQEGEPEPHIHITQIDKSQFPSVTVYMSITDDNGEPVGIDPARIQLAEDGIPLEADQIEGLGQVEAFTTLLVMDVSGSMNQVGKLETAKEAAREFVEQMRVGDRVGLLAFNTEITYPQPITSNQETIIATIGGLEAFSDTAMYDALVEAVEILKSEAGRKAIIVLTDGMDNRSAAGVDAVLSGIDPSGLTISTVGLGDPAQQTASTAGIDEAALQLLADRAGGDYAYANDRQQLTDLYSQYARALQSEYVITYTSPGGLHDGLNRNLTVSLSDTEDVTGQAAYNPGGLVPEVASMVSWPMFLVVLSVLVILLLVPAVIQSGQAFATRSMPGASKKKSRIKLLD